MIQKNLPQLQTLQQFLDNLTIEAGLSNNTITSYKADLQHFYSFLQKRKPIKDLKSATTVDILDYINKLASQHFNAKTQSRRISAIKRFYKFCYSEQIINSNPALDLKNPKISKSLPKFLQINEVEALLNYAKQHNYMFYVMLEVLYSTGLRVTELVSLPLSSIIEDGNFLLVTGKGNKQRIVPLTKVAKLQLTNWLSVRKQIKNLDKNNIYIFPSTTAKQQYITRERFAQILKHTAIQCNINHTMVSPHVLRHSFASHILNNGGSLMHIKTLLGHSDISTTEIYTHILGNKYAQAVYNNHPLSKTTFTKPNPKLKP